MRAYLIAALALLAGCGPPPVLSQRALPATPPSVPPPSGAAMTEGRAVMNAVMARPRGEARQVIREMAERNIGPAPANTSRAAAADYARRLEAEERRLLQAWNTEMDQQDRLTRQHDYCGDYAHRVWLRVMGMPGAFRSVEREAYDDCMAAFARVDRFSAPRTR